MQTLSLFEGKEPINQSSLQLNGVWGIFEKIRENLKIFSKTRIFFFGIDSV